MRKIYLCSAFFTLFLLLFAPACFAANSLDVAINEIAWMGTAASYNDEWIELYNNTNQDINLDGWMLKASDGTPEISLAGIVIANGFYLLERTDDNTLPSILANLIYTGALGNSGEKLGLYDGLGNLIDQVDCSSSWFSGDNLTKQTMERINPKIFGSNTVNWQTSQNPGGTPRAVNSQQLVINKEEKVKPEETEIGTQENPAEEKNENNVQPQSLEEVINYPSGVVFNEILPSPKGSDETEEWIEIFNQNNFEVDLSGWKISDTAGKTTTFIFPAGSKISTKGYLVLNRPITKITLNNDGDALNLIQPNNNIIDKISFEKAPTGQSYNKIENSWVWSDSLTPGAENIIPQEETGKESEAKDDQGKGMAAVSNLFNEENQSGGKMTKFPIILASAFGIAVLSGITILFLKKKLKKED